MFTTKNLLILIGRNIIISLFVILLTLAAVIFLSKEISQISNRVALNNKLSLELKKRTDLFETLKQDAQTIGKNNTIIENAFTPSNDVSGFINALDLLAEKNKIAQIYHFETPILSSISSVFPISTIIYSNSFESSVLSFSSYLKEFGKLPYFTKIDGFNITSQDSQGWLGKSTISYKATLYTKEIK